MHILNGTHLEMRRRHLSYKISNTKRNLSWGIIRSQKSFIKSLNWNTVESFELNKISRPWVLKREISNISNAKVESNNSIELQDLHKELWSSLGAHKFSRPRIKLVWKVKPLRKILKNENISKWTSSFKSQNNWTTLYSKPERELALFPPPLRLTSIENSVKEISDSQDYQIKVNFL
jgi:hypothetical protein